MKTILALILLSAFCLTGCATDGYYRPSYGYYQQQTFVHPYRRPHYPSQCTADAHLPVGPQYYKTQVNYPGPMNFKNYSNAPVVVQSPYGPNRIVAPSWD
jgi:hypothetical protein